VRCLLDTHALLWWLDGDRRLPRTARTLIANGETVVFVSAASAWEITTKARLGKLPGATDVAGDVAAAVSGQAFVPLDITLLHAQRAGRLDSPHRDPFDRMLIAQAQIEGLPIVSGDDVFDAFGVERIWMK
jgi:PIN domain nuclease of toxin-antitoxin system